MEIRSIRIDFDKDILEINGKKVEKPVIVKTDSWSAWKYFSAQ